MELLLEYLELHHLDAILISRPENVRYISHYTGDDTFLLITNIRKFCISDPRYTEQISYECPDYHIVDWRQYGSLAAALKEVAEQHKLKTIGFESTHLAYAVYQAVQKAVPAELVPTEGVVEEFRRIKRPEEVACLRAACEISSRAFEKILKDIRAGITEKELASRLSHYMVMEGSDTKPYGNILISGARTSLLHGIPSSKAIEYGDLVLMDYGCQYHGYLSDMTRTVVVGKATSKQREVYSLEQQMVQDVLNFLKDGVKASDAYAVSVQAVSGTEYEPYHYSGIGHGVGMFVHESPTMSPDSKDLIQAGNVVTVEPGIYIPGWGGVRIEDQILITPSGNENLINATKELIEL